MWDVRVTSEVREWMRQLARVDFDSHEQVVAAIFVLAEYGPTLGRPLVDRINGSVIHNLKELRPGSANSSEIRILFAFDPWRSSILLIAGDKRGQWKEWYRRAIPVAERLFAAHLAERAEEEGIG